MLYNFNYIFLSNLVNIVNVIYTGLWTWLMIPAESNWGMISVLQSSWSLPNLPTKASFHLQKIVEQKGFHYVCSVKLIYEQFVHRNVNYSRETQCKDIVELSVGWLFDIILYWKIKSGLFHKSESDGIYPSKIPRSQRLKWRIHPCEFPFLWNHKPIDIELLLRYTS